MTVYHCFVENDNNMANIRLSATVISKTIIDIAKIRLTATALSKTITDMANIRLCATGFF